MKFSTIILVAVIIILSSFKNSVTSEPELVCMMVHRQTNSCHFNFTIDGEKFRFTDTGCKYKTKKEEVIKKVNEGSIALTKQWKMECPAPKVPSK